MLSRIFQIQLRLHGARYRTCAFFFAGLLYGLLVISAGQTSGIYYDSVQYVAYGANLLREGVYGAIQGVPDMNREPGYGFYLAALFGLVRGVGLADLASLSLPEGIFWVKVLQAWLLFLAAGLCAFRGGLQTRMRWPLFFILVFSPSSIGAVREIYSEALAVPLSVLLLFCVARALRQKSRVFSIASAVSFGLLVLTKSYLYHASFVFLAVALGGFLYKRARTEFSGLFLALALGGLVAQQTWNYRNSRLFGENASEARLSIALAGKVARLHQVNWRNDLPVSLAGSLGTNFCDRIFGPERCSQFDYRGCDQIGNDYLARYKSLYGANRLVDQHLKRDMLRLYFERPFTQLAGSGLELLRMFFFEAVLDAGTLPGPFQPLARAWHIAGSLLLWILIVASWRSYWRSWKSLAIPDRHLALFCALLLVYHAGTMAQITNVVRYVFPVIPFLYFFAAGGVVSLINRGRAA